MYKVEEKSYLGVREQKRLNTTGLDDLNKACLALPQMSSKNVCHIELTL
jgi:hypothetical protein